MSGRPGPTVATRAGEPAARLALYRKPADGSGDAEQLTHEDLTIFVSDWSSDGRYVLALRIGQEDLEAGWQNGADLGYLDLEEGEGLRRFLATEFQESEAAFSPDVRWVAYQSNESGRTEVYVRPFPAAGGRWQISDHGGGYPRWSADGRELFYRTDDGIMAVDVDVDGTRFSASRPRRRQLVPRAPQGGTATLESETRAWLPRCPMGPVAGVRAHAHPHSSRRTNFSSEPGADELDRRDCVRRDHQDAAAASVLEPFQSRRYGTGFL